MLKTEFVVAIDPGTIWNGIALKRPDEPIETWVHRIYDFSLSTCVNTLDVGLRYAVAGQQLINAIDSLGQSGSVIRIAQVFIEKPDSKITKKKKLAGELDEHYPLVLHSVKLWRRWFEMQSSYVMVDYVDSLKWQRSELLHGASRRQSYSGASFSELSIRTARTITGNNNINCSHTADAICLLSHGERLLATQ